MGMAELSLLEGTGLHDGVEEGGEEEGLTLSLGLVLV